MSLELAEKVTRWMGGLVAYATLGIVMFGIWRGTHRPAGRTAGRNPGWLRSPLFYLVSVVLFMGISAALWHPLPLTILPPMPRLGAGTGDLDLFPGHAIHSMGAAGARQNVLSSQLDLAPNYMPTTSW